MLDEKLCRVFDEKSCRMFDRELCRVQVTRILTRRTKLVLKPVGCSL